MKTTLRDHPLLTCEGLRNWPPRWFRTSGQENATAAGEVGTLRDVKTHDAISSQCFLFIEHDGATFMGRLSCDSVALCQTIVRLLKLHRGEPLKLIGEIGVDLSDIEVSLASAA